METPDQLTPSRSNLFPNLFHELCNRRQGRVCLIALWRMPAFRERKNFHWSARLPRNRLHLRHGPVLILETLNGKNRTSDTRKKFFNVPQPKIGMQPNIIPSPERACSVAMMPS